MSETPESDILSRLDADTLYLIAVRERLRQIAKKPLLLAGPESAIPPAATVEEIGHIIEHTLPGRPGFLQRLLRRRSIWLEVKDQFRLLLCTDDRRYAALRRNLLSASSKSQLTIVSTISAALAGTFGVAAGALVPLCAICLIAALKLGKEAYCKGTELDVPVGPRAPMSTEEMRRVLRSLEETPGEPEAASPPSVQRKKESPL
jgi:hypothetical protein